MSGIISTNRNKKPPSATSASSVSSKILSTFKVSIQICVNQLWPKDIFRSFFGHFSRSISLATSTAATSATRATIRARFSHQTHKRRQAFQKSFSQVRRSSQVSPVCESYNCSVTRFGAKMRPKCFQKFPKQIPQPF